MAGLHNLKSEKVIRAFERAGWIELNRDDQGNIRSFVHRINVDGAGSSVGSTFPEATKWKTFVTIGALSFASFWAIASISWIIIAFMVRKSKHKRNS